MSQVKLGLLGALLVCSAGCASIAPPSAGVAPVTPPPNVVTVAPPPSPTAVPGGLRACAHGDVGVGAVRWAGATATVQGIFVVYDTGSEPCWIAGPVVVAILASGAPLAIEVRARPDSTSDPVSLLPGLGEPKVGDVAVPGRAIVEIFWSNWCSQDAIRSAALRVSVPEIGSFDVPLAQLTPPRCDSPGSPSVLTVGPLTSERAGAN
jgi:hypothetical protein